MKKRALSALLCLALCFTLAGQAAAAEGGVADPHDGFAPICVPYVYIPRRGAVARQFKRHPVGSFLVKTTVFVVSVKIDDLRPRRIRIPLRGDRFDPDLVIACRQTYQRIVGTPSSPASTIRWRR